MRAGLLREVVTIQRKEVVETAYSGKKTVYADYITTRARVEHNRGNKGIAAGEVFTEYAVTFTIRYYHQVTADMIVLHGGNKYRIVDINPQKLQQQLIITGELIND